MSLQDGRGATTSANHEAHSQEKLSLLLNELLKLGDADLLRILVRLPAHRLAQSLEFVLRSQSATTETPTSTQAKAETTEPNATDEQSDERRTENRSKTLRGGRIIFNNKMSVVNCTIRDMTSKGCQIRLDSTVLLPKFFTLQITNSDTKRECEVAWRDHNTMGLKFID